MATSYHILEGVKIPKKTVFKYYLNSCMVIEKTESQPFNWENVLYIGHDPVYGDVFKCWDNEKDIFTLFFGEVGDEFK